MKSVIFTIITTLISLQGYASLNFGTYNIRNFDRDRLELSRTDKDLLYSIIYQMKADLIAVQEIYNQHSFRSFIRQYLPDYGLILSRCGGAGKQKLGFIYNKKNLKLLSYYEDSSISMSEDCHVGLRPAVIAKFKHFKTGQYFSAISLHLKAGDKDSDLTKRLEQLALLGEIIKRTKAKGSNNIVALGDFNTTGYIFKDFEYEAFRDFLSANSLYNFSSKISCSSYWFAGKDKNIFKSSLLDHIIVSNEFMSLFKGKDTKLLSHCQKHQCHEKKEYELGKTFKYVSDHCPVVSNLY